ncbi:protein S100-A16-like isoform X1 [Lissotriton helveticus]
MAQGTSAAMASNCSDLERSIEVLVKNFYLYAGKKEKMNRRDFRKMVGAELSHILTNTQSKEGADKLIKSLDANDDGKISFEEYWTLVSEIAKKLSQQMAIQNQESG